MRPTSAKSPQPEPKSIRKFLFFSVGFGLLIASLFFASSVLSQEATSPAIPDEQIKENLKERLEKAIMEKPQAAQVQRAWVGTLESIANHTLTIETREGPKLASVSAETTYIRLPKRTVVKQEDLELGSYTIAMGNLNGKQVLNAQRVIINDEPPPALNRQAHFVTILDYDSEAQILRVELPSGETLELTVTGETIVTTAADSQILEAPIEAAIPGQPAIIIAIEADQETTLLRLHFLPLKEEVGALQPASAEADSQAATQSPESSPAPELGE